MKIQDIVARISARAGAVGLSLAQLSKSIDRDAGYLGDAKGGKKRDIGATELPRIAAELDCSVAYLMGEDEMPNPTEPPPASREAPERWVLSAGGGASFGVPDRPVFALALEDAEGGREVFLIPEPVSLVLHSRLEQGLSEIAAYETEKDRSTSNSAS